MSVSKKEIAERWKNRIVLNGWNKLDGSGVISYLMKYGKNISDDKLEAFAEYAREIGYPMMEKEFIANTTYGLFKRYGEKLPSYLNQDFNRFFYFDKDFDKEEQIYTLFQEEKLYVAVVPLTFEKLKNFLRSEEKYCIIEYTKEYCCVVVSIKEISDFRCCIENGKRVFTYNNLSNMSKNVFIEKEYDKLESLCFIS